MSVENTIQQKMLQEKVVEKLEMFHLCNYFVLFSSIDEWSSMCLEGGRNSGPFIGGQEKNTAFWEHILFFPAAGAISFDTGGLRQ